MQPRIIDKEMLILAGFSFYGNPFEIKDPWDEENEIGKLWQRFMAFMEQAAMEVKPNLAETGVFYEVCVSHPNTKVTGDLEVFVGAAIQRAEALPVEMTVKVLPACRYVVFTFQGAQINSDWHRMIYEEWMPQAGYSSAHPFEFQYYDHRFKGVANLAESEIDVYVPIKKSP